MKRARLARLSALLILVGLFCVPTLGWGAQSAGHDANAFSAEDPASFDRFRVWLWTMDQGDEVYALFGHNALVIEDRWTGQSLAWNWGLFNFEDEDFLPRFLRGTMRYSMGPADPGAFLDSYVRANRTVYQNEVHLTQSEAEALDALVRWNFEPANRPYVYHYFQDNCSTRIRDALDQVLGGSIQAHFESRPFPWSYRQQARHLVQRVGWVDQGLSFLLGSRGDLPRSEYEAMFVPVTLMTLLENFERDEGPGTESRRALLGPREILFQSSRTELPPTPPTFAWTLLWVGLGGAGLLVGLARAAFQRARGAPLVLGVLGAGLALGSGLLGALLVFSLFTDHGFMHWNLNLFQVHPGHLLLGVLLPLYLVSGRGGWLLGRTSLALAGLSVLGLLLQGLGALNQGNADVLAWAVPLNLGYLLAVRSILRRPGVPSTALSL